MPFVRVFIGVRTMSRTIDRAPLAVTSDGTVLLNVARFDVPRRIEEIVRVAMSQRGVVFIGVALSPAETKRLLKEVALILPNASAPLVGRRQRGILGHRRSRRR
jgi:hypothetical protein